MLYLDVTGGCTLPLQSGIPRTTRELHRLCQGHLAQFLPIRWQPFRSTYTQLSRPARAILETPAIPRRPPRDTTWPIMLAALRDVPRWPALVPLHRKLTAGDTLLLTSLFPDNRIPYLEKLAASPLRRIAVFHDAIPLRDPNVPDWERAHHLRALRLLTQFDCVIAVSAHSRDDLLDLAAANQFDRPNVTVLPWPAPFAQPRPPFVAPSTKAKNLLYVSRLKQVKNHHTLLAACSTLWDEGLPFSVTLIGCEDEPRESAAIRQAIHQLTRAGRPIAWRAQVTEDELHAAYRAASFTVFPSRHEGFGLPILESFWHGRGVVCSGTGAMGEVSLGPGALHIDITQPAELTATLRHLLTNDQATQALAQQAHSRPLRTWDNYWQDLAPILAS